MASSVGFAVDAQRLTGIVQDINKKIKTLDERISSIWFDIDEEIWFIWAGEEGLDYVLFQKKISNINYDSVQREIEEAIAQKKPYKDQIHKIQRVFNSVRPSQAASSSSSSSSANPDFRLVLSDSGNYVIRGGRMIDGVRCVSNFGREYNPLENVTEVQLKEQMTEAIRAGSDNLLRRVMSSSLVGSFVERYPAADNDLSDFELALQLSQQDSPVFKTRTSSFDWGTDDSINETIQMARFDVNDLFERVNPYDRPAEEILTLLDVKIPTTSFPLSVRVTYGHSDTDAIYWNIPIKKNNGRAMELEDWKDCLFEILFFGPALYTHLHSWARLKIFLSTDFVERSGERNFSMGIHQIGDENVCPLSILMKEETEWKTFVALPKEFYSEMKPTEVFRVIDDFIWSKLRQYLRPEVYTCLNGIFDPATNTSTSEIRSIEEDCACEIRWTIEGAGSLVLSLEFKPSAHEQNKTKARQRLYNFLLTYVNQSKMELITQPAHYSRIIVEIRYNPEISEVLAPVSNDLLNLSRHHQDKGVIIDMIQVRDANVAKFRGCDPELLDFMAAIFDEFFSNIKYIEYKLQRGPGYILMSYQVKQTGMSQLQDRSSHN